MSDTIDALEALVHSSGWHVVCEVARKEWAERERIGVRNVVSREGGDPIDKLRQIVAAREAVEWVLTLPSEEIAKLKRQEREPGPDTVSRVAGVAPLMVGMSRRGSL